MSVSEGISKDSPICTYLKEIEKFPLLSVEEERNARLSQREQLVRRMRFELDDEYRHTLKAVGKEFNITRERIHQIEAKACTKTRYRRRKHFLKDFLD